MADGFGSDCGHHHDGFPAPSIDVIIEDDPGTKLRRSVNAVRDVYGIAMTANSRATFLSGSC